jgi:hypothetical protein
LVVLSEHNDDYQKPARLLHAEDSANAKSNFSGVKQLILIMQ